VTLSLLVLQVETVLGVSLESLYQQSPAAL